MPAILTQLLVLLLSGIASVALIVVLGVLFPGWIDRTRRTAEEHPRSSFLVGLVNFVFFASISLGFFILANNNSGIFYVPALFIAAPLGIGVVFGLAGMVALVGERLFPAHSLRARTALAAATLYVACLTPIVGWFALSGYLGIAGLGAFLMGIVRRPAALMAPEEGTEAA